MMTKKENAIRVGRFLIERMIDDADHAGDVSLLRNVNQSLIERYVPASKISLPFTSLLIRNGNKNILIDTGEGNRLLQNLAARGVKPEEVSAVLITHMHPDHIGGLLHEGRPSLPNADIYISEQEKLFWQNEENLEKLPEFLQTTLSVPFKKAQEVLRLYQSRIKLFTASKLLEATEDLIPGFIPIDARGHTPGHTAYLVHDQDEKVFVMGDTFHAMQIQFPHPEVTLKFDIDPKMAAETRHRFFDYVCTNEIPFTGTHKATEPFGFLRAVHPEKKQGYLFERI